MIQAGGHGHKDGHRAQGVYQGKKRSKTQQGKSYQFIHLQLFFMRVYLILRFNMIQNNQLLSI